MAGQVCNTPQVCRITRIVDAYKKWRIEVDGKTIEFSYIINAEYFYQHYKALGYQMEIVEPAGFLLSMLVKHNPEVPT